MTRIAFIINDLSFGGAQIQTIELANNLAKRNYDIMMFSLGPEDKLKNTISPAVKTVLIGKKSYLDFKALSRLVKEIKGFKPESVVCVNSYSTFYGYFAHLLSGIAFKRISVQHTTIITGWREKLKNIMYTVIMNKMDKLVFVCNNQLKHWIEEYRIKPTISKVIYNGIDLEKFENFDTDISNIRQSLGFKPEDIIIGINAVLRPEKKHEDMVDALELLVKEGYPIKLLFIGDGIRRGFIEDYIKSKGLTDRVVITGFLKDVRPYLACVDISALTSTAVETLSIAALESMAMGKPLILSDIGGARELVDQGVNGIVYTAGNVIELYKSIKYLIDNGITHSMGENSRIKVKKLFSREMMTEKYEELLKIS